MLKLISAFLLGSAALSFAHAAEFKPTSKIDAVTVYPNGAKVERIVVQKLPKGEHVIRIDDLPSNLFVESVRVHGSADGNLVQNSVDVTQIVIPENDHPQARKALENQIAALHDETLLVRQLQNDNSVQREILKSLMMSGGSHGIEKASIDAQGISELVKLSAEQLSRLTSQSDEYRLRQKAIDSEIFELDQKLKSLAPKQRTAMQVEINVTALEDVSTELEISYQVSGAGWQPIYDANLTLIDNVEDASIKLDRRAKIFQKTGEVWDNVQLTLSTSRPSLKTSSPDLKPNKISEYLASRGRALTSSKVVVSPNTQSEVAMEKLLSADILAKQVVNAPIQMMLAGFDAEFKLPSRASIPNTSEVKTLFINSYAMGVDLYALSVPKLDKNAYLTAKFEFNGQVPILPGAVLLSRNGSFIGKGYLPTISPGEDFDLGFGVDDAIVVERRETSKKKGDAGFITSTKITEWQYKTKITNNHAFPIDVLIKDNLPVSEHEDILVTMSSNSTKPTQKNIDDQSGILGWHYEMAAGAKQEVDFGYKISWPETFEIGLTN